MATDESDGPSDLALATSVAEAMACPVVTVDAETGMQDLLRLFLAGGISAAPVVDAGGKPLGVLSKTDLLREQYDNPEGFRRPPAGAYPQDAGGGPEPTEASLAASRARDIMTPGPVLIEKGASLGKAVKLMARENVHRVFVVDELGAIVGVLAAIDVVRWLARRSQPA